MPLFDNNTTLVTSLGTLVDGDGNIRRHVRAHAALTAMTAYAVVWSSTGLVTSAATAATVSTTGALIRVVVPDRAVASGATFWGITGGAVDAMICDASLDATSNKYIEYAPAGAQAIEAAPVKTSIFGICTDADNDDEHDVILFDREIIIPSA